MKKTLTTAQLDVLWEYEQAGHVAEKLGLTLRQLYRRLLNGESHDATYFQLAYAERVSASRHAMSGLLSNHQSMGYGEVKSATSDVARLVWCVNHSYAFKRYIKRKGYHEKKR